VPRRCRGISPARDCRRGRIPAKKVGPADKNTGHLPAEPSRGTGSRPADTEGSRQLRRAVSEKIANALRGQPLPPEQVERRRKTAEQLNLGQYLDPAHGAGWSAAELQLLGRAPDEEVAARIGRTANAVRLKRTRLGIPDPGGHGWTAEEVALLGTAPDAEVAARIGRTRTAVTQKRWELRIPTFRDLRFREGRA